LAVLGRVAGGWQSEGGNARPMRGWQWKAGVGNGRWEAGREKRVIARRAVARRVMRGGYYDAGSASRQCDVGNARLTVGGGQWEASSERRAIARRVMRGGLLRRGQCTAGSAKPAVRGRQCKG